MNALKNFKTVVRTKVLKRFQRPYQVKLASSADLRWEMITAEPPDDTGNLLDIGSNLGDFTARAGRLGLWAFGLEPQPRLVDRAQRLHRDVPYTSFSRTKLDLDSCHKLPSYDVVLVLSVHHHWHMNFGPDTANAMLREMGKRTNKVMFFEGPSRTARYDRFRPHFIDNDEKSVTDYYGGLLRKELGSEFEEIKLLGRSPCVGEREPYRWLYSLKK